MRAQTKHAQFLFSDFTSQLICNIGDETTHHCQQKHQPYTKHVQFLSLNGFKLTFFMKKNLHEKS